MFAIKLPALRHATTTRHCILLALPCQPSGSPKTRWPLSMRSGAEVSRNSASGRYSTYRGSVSTQSPTRKRDPHRKRAILSSAARLVADRGYAGVTMADIGTDIGITASALYWHYSSKQTLLVAFSMTAWTGFFASKDKPSKTPAGRLTV